MKRYIRRKQYLNGEFIPTYYKWKTPDEQRKIVSRLENITKPQKED